MDAAIDEARPGRDQWRARTCSLPPGRQPTSDCSPRVFDFANAKLLAESDLRFMAMTTSGLPDLEPFDETRLNCGEGRTAVRGMAGRVGCEGEGVGVGAEGAAGARGWGRGVPRTC